MFGGGGAFGVEFATTDVVFQPIALGVSQLGDVGFAIALVFAQEIVAGADGEAHEPVFEGRIAAEGGEMAVGFGPDFLDDVFDLAFAAGVTARGGEEAGGIFAD